MTNRACDDTALLQLTHGELSVLERLPLYWHLLHCPDCQARLDAYTRLSQNLAVALQGSGTPRIFRRTLPTTVLVIGLAGVIVLSLSALGWEWRRSLSPTPASFSESLKESCEEATHPSPAPPADPCTSKEH